MPNLFDATVEPTDEQLGELMARAFAKVREPRALRTERHERSIEYVRTALIELRRKYPNAFFQ